MIPPVLVQMTVVHEPSLQLLQFAAHLPPLLCKAPCFCAFLFGELAMLDFRLCESRKAVLGPWTSGSPSMELTAAHRQSSGALAWRPPARSGLATNTLPVWAVEPCFEISFHCAQLSSVYGVLLYPILDGIARHARLGPRTADRAKLTNADWAQATLILGRRWVVLCPRPLAPCLYVSTLDIGPKHSFIQIVAKGCFEPNVAITALFGCDTEMGECSTSFRAELP